MTNHTALISVMCTDRVGLVADIAGCLFDLGGNLNDATFAVLGGGAEFTGVCEFPGDLPLAEVERSLRNIESLADADVSVTVFGMAPVHDETARVTHHLTLRGGNQPGLIARLCEVFVQFRANVVRLSSERIPGKGRDDYAIDIAVRIPPDSVPTCLATVGNTAGELGLSFGYRTH